MPPLKLIYANLKLVYKFFYKIVNKFF